MTTHEHTLPCGRPVHALPSCGSPTRELDHSEPVVAERIAWQTERFQVGTIVRRDDGCTIRITSFGRPSVGATSRLTATISTPTRSSPAEDRTTTPGR